MLDSKRWDVYHKKALAADMLPSEYAKEREPLFPRNSIIVDLGGGMGVDALYFLEKGHSVIILDISKYALNVARELAKARKLDTKLITKQVDFSLHSIPLKPDSVDICYSRLSLNYFDTSETTTLFCEILAILKQGGKSYLTFKSPNDIEEIEHLKKRATLLEENVFIDSGQIRSRFSGEQLEQICKNAGIANYEVKEYVESLTGEGDAIRQMMCNEVVFSKLTNNVL